MRPQPTDESMPATAPPGLLPRPLWLVLPPLALAAHLGWRIVDEASYRRAWDTEQGPEENLTVLLLAVAVGAGLLALRRARQIGRPLVLAWIVAMTAGSAYFAGEEASWGQHWFGWGTPEAFSRLNDQNETNLHNMSSWLDQKPRLALELWVLVGGLLAPLGLARRLGLTGGFWSWIWPPREAALTAALAVLVGIIERGKGLLGLTNLAPIDVRLSETQELYFAWFLMLSLWAIAARAARQRAAG
jgi:hypothetical protein